jgi:hypothetical protein
VATATQIILATLPLYSQNAMYDHDGSLGNIIKIIEIDVCLKELLTTTFNILSVLAIDDRHIAFCEYNGSVARIICVAVATLANEKLLERAL